MKLKFCGFTRIDDVKFAIELGVDFQGFIFFSSSKRFIPIEVFDNIFRYTKGGNFVGVFVNEDIARVIQISKTYNLAFVQLHGDENNDYIKDILLQDVNVIKAFRIKNDDDILKIKESVSEYILVDTFVEGMYGGTGKSIDLNLLDNLFSSVKNKKIFISGGINAQNISEIVKMFGKYAYGIDLSSGIEEKPGIKSHILMKEVFSKFTDANKLFYHQL